MERTPSTTGPVTRLQRRRRSRSLDRQLPTGPQNSSSLQQTVVASPEDPFHQPQTEPPRLLNVQENRNTVEMPHQSNQEASTRSNPRFRGSSPIPENEQLRNISLNQDRNRQAILGLARSHQELRTTLSSLQLLPNANAEASLQANAESVPQGRQTESLYRWGIKPVTWLDSIPMCNGLDSQLLLDFIVQIDSLVETRVLPERQLMEMLVLKTEGYLRQRWYEIISHNRQWSLVKTNLIRTLLSDLDLEHLRTQLIYRWQKPSESFREYIQDIVSKSRALNLCMTEAELASIIFNHINNETFNLLRIAKPPNNIQELRVLADQIYSAQCRHQAYQQHIQGLSDAIQPSNDRRQQSISNTASELNRPSSSSPRRFNNQRS